MYSRTGAHLATHNIVYNGIQTIARMNTIPNEHDPQQHYSEWTLSEMDTIPNGHDPEWYVPEWTQFRLDATPNEHLDVVT